MRQRHTTQGSIFWIAPDHEIGTIWRASAAEVSPIAGRARRIDQATTQSGEQGDVASDKTRGSRRDGSRK